jgi:L-glyceraldehyde reductase
MIIVSCLATFQTSANSSSVVDDPEVQKIATKLGKDPAAVLISWAVQRGTAVVPKSVTPSRIESNFQGMLLLLFSCLCIS